MSSYTCESPVCGGDMGRCSNYLLCQNTGRLPPSKLIASTILPLALGSTPLNGDVLGKLLKGEEIVTVSIQDQDNK